MASNPFGPGAPSEGDEPSADEVGLGEPGLGELAADEAELGADDYDLVDVKEAFGLPDALPPIRLASLPELAARARQAPLARQLGALAQWVGEQVRHVDEDGDLGTEDFAAATADLALESGEDLVFLWEYALAVEWLAYDEDADDRVVPAVMAQGWADGDDETVFDVWSSTLAAVLSDTIEVSGPADPNDLAKLGLDDLQFYGQPMALAVLLFMTRRDGLSQTDFTEVLWENAAGDVPPEQAAKLRKKWTAYYGDPARLLLDKLSELHAVTESEGIVRLTPLALAALHEQLVDAGVDIPVLPPTAAELTAAQLLAMAEGVSDEEFEAEAGAWVAARGSADAARDLLAVAAAANPGERLIAVAAVTRIGAAAEPAWRVALFAPELRGYAKVALLTLAGGEVPDEFPAPGQAVPADLEPQPDDLAWMATDLLAITCDDEFPDPDELAESFREAVPPGREATLFEAMWRGSHPHALHVLNHIGRHHPDRQVAKAARTAAYKATSRRASRP
jgi:hypothetical protein